MPSSWAGQRINRRDLLRLSIAVGSAGTLASIASACAPAASSPPATPASEAKTQSAPPPAPAQVAPTVASSAAKPATNPGANWTEIEAAAKKEGVLVLSTHAGAQVWDNINEEVKKALPNLEVQSTPMKSTDWAPRVIVEQRNDQYLWDVHLGPSGQMYTVLTPAGAFENITPFLDVLPQEVSDDTKWAGGFRMFTDPTRPVTFITHFDISGGFFVNRKLAPKEEVNTWEDLLNPKWKDQILLYDPFGATGSGFVMAELLQPFGEDFIRKLMGQVKLLDNIRAATEYVAQGRYPISIYANADMMRDLQKQGVGTDVENARPTSHVISYGTEVLKNAPHPNAAKVFLRWYLSQQGQETMAKALETSTRRLGIKSHAADESPDYSNLAQYTLKIGTAEGEAILARTIKVLKEFQ